MSNVITIQVGTQLTTTVPGEIPPGTIMQQGSWAISPHGIAVLFMQMDGNLVVYEVVGPPPISNGSFKGRELWATGTNVTPDPVGYTFNVQTDCNLVVYRDDSTSAWSSGTYSDTTTPQSLNIQDDGNLVYYSTTSSVIWAANNAVPADPLVKIKPFQVDSGIVGNDHKATRGKTNIQLTGTSSLPIHAYHVHDNRYHHDCMDLVGCCPLVIGNPGDPMRVQPNAHHGLWQLGTDASNNGGSSQRRGGGPLTGNGTLNVGSGGTGGNDDDDDD